MRGNRHGVMMTFGALTESVFGGSASEETFGSMIGPDYFVHSFFS